MTEIKITITAPDLSEAINNLAVALAGGIKAPASTQVTAPAVPVPPINTTASAEVSAQQPMNTPTVDSVQAQTPATAPAAKTYTLDDLSLAAAALIDEGKMQAIMATIQKYGVPAINLLRQDQYAAFAADLRAIGGQI